MENQEDVLVTRKEEEVRESVISEYGFDPEVDAERISKLVERELESDKKLSSAIGAKIKMRTERDEFKAKVPLAKEEKVEETKGDLVSRDTIALIQAKVIESEDIDEVLEYAKFKKISVSEALKSSVVKATLAEKAEFRRTAEAANTGTNKRVVNKVDDAAALEETFQKGEIPDKGSTKAEQVFWARRGGKK